MFILCFAPTCNAETAYKTYTVNREGSYIETQTAYKTLYTITKISEVGLSAPEDICIYDKKLYIADTGNKRVIICDLDGENAYEFGQDIFEKPTSIFVSNIGEIFVADEGKQSVFRFSSQNELLMTYGKPDELLYGKSSSFIPKKVVVDAKDNMFVVSSGNTNGIVQLSVSTGDFLGYFGANNTITTLWQRIAKKIFSDSQLEQMMNIAPPSATNLAIDEKGLIYTITNVGTETPVKKLNMAGLNIINEQYQIKNPVDIAIGEIGNIIVATADGFVLEFNSEGSLMFAFGGLDDGKQRVGLVGSISGVEVDDEGLLFVLDNKNNVVQVYEPTEFCEKVHTALYYYQQGKYLQSKEPWEEVLSMNSFFDYANRSIGEAYYKEENYSQAMESFALANYKKGYSEAFSEVRNLWLKQHIVQIIGLIALFMAVVYCIKLVDRKTACFAGVKKFVRKIKNNKLVSQLSFSMYMTKNPVDACYGIKRENKTSVLSASILYGLFFLIYLINKYCSGYIFSSYDGGGIDIINDVAFVIGGFALAISSNYLISSITEGEASVKNLYIGFIYSVVPYIVLKPFTIIFSYVLTDNERFIITFLNIIIYAVSIVVLIIMIKEMNNYSVGETVKNILLTLFTMVVIIAVIFVLFVLFKQLYEFLQELVSEVIYRVTR